MPAQFLLRFDDICPTMNWRNWEPVEQILVDAGIRPLLGVVPDNCDPELRFGPADPAFWQRVRGWQNRGWSIGLHGFQHCYVSASAGILGRNPFSEFAGLPGSIQRNKLERALEIFRREEIRPDAFIAPAHSFDDVTIRLLASLGLNCISDGYSLFPYVCSAGMLWVPQQLGRFHKMPFGTWTITLHVNPWTSQQIEGFREEIAAFREATVSLDEIRSHYQTRQKAFSDQLLFNCIRTIRSLRA